METLIGNQEDIKNEMALLRRWYDCGMLDAAEYYLAWSKLQNK